MPSQFIKPQALENLSPRGSYDYLPVVTVLEADSPAELNALLQSEVSTTQNDPAIYAVLKSTSYQTTQQGMSAKYSVCLHFEVAIRK